MYLNSTIENFRLSKDIGTGSHGVIFLSIPDDSTQYQTAVKVFKPEWAKLANAEIRFLSKNIKHKNLITHISSGNQGNLVDQKDGSQSMVPYIAMEYCPKGDFLDCIMSIGSFPESAARACLTQILDGLEAMHQAGYFHGDVKPENVLIGNDGSLKLTDFGFTDKITSVHKQYRGTLGYLPPEVVAREPYDGVQADLFAAGVIAYMMVFCQMPFNIASRRDPRYSRILRNDWTGFWLGTRIRSSALFREFIESMLTPKPEDRLSLQEIREHPWMQGPMASDEDIAKLMSKV